MGVASAAEECLYLFPHFHFAQSALALDPGVKVGRDVYGESGCFDALCLDTLCPCACHPLIRCRRLLVPGFRPKCYLLGHCSISSNILVVNASISWLARLSDSISKTV